MTKMTRPEVDLPAEYCSGPDGSATRDDLERYALALADFIRKYSKFFNFHAVDFFVEHTFEAICPLHWRDLVADPTVDDDLFLDHVIHLASNSPSKFAELQSVWPADLMAFITQALTIGLPRSPKSFDLDPIKLDKNMALGMTPKKIIEVEILAAFISHIAKSAGVQNLIDLGAGQGYLSSILALHYGHNVLGVDTDPIQTSGAIRRRATLLKRNRKRLPNMGRLVYLNKHVTADDTFDGLVHASKEQLRAAVADPSDTSVDPELATGDDLDWAKGKWGLIGLHTCGDLAPITLRMWMESTAALVINCGCCYNHLSEAIEDQFAEDMLAPGTRDKFLKTRIIAASRKKVWPGAEPVDVTSAACCNTEPEVAGFPMSSVVTKIGINLGWTARMLACQSTCRWAAQGDAAKEAFRRHLYRALLQVVIHDVTGESPVVSVHTAKTRRGALPPFSEYVQGAIAALIEDHGRPAGKGETEPAWVAKLRAYMVDADALEAFYKERVAKGAFKEIALVWTLRALMAESIESLIVLDRYLWVAEQGYAAAGASKEAASMAPGWRGMLFPLFDHIESPRNCVIVGVKGNGAGESK
ncbi:hypothetical protein AMAG_12011 [Allomyces macrogynus ATCC 38327]|uniref:Methyltransferase domain-containing protein n=1 Tax=Allomyces macrogynus (strain ATCC 38327) TaxID=578462 RepID=A0A0L0SYE5_ALLM3|nr:hypothetical protein AMAG_12011 [Allomyces macrogynus ATCC 38327]|eukprot:KNE67558.1 hypothetical protein AMAG_12011 [Allomyces macrogynus ATCC 38327]